MKFSRVLRWIFIISLLGGIALSIFSQVFYFSGLLRWRYLIVASLIIALTSSVALACALTIERGRVAILLWSGIAAAVMAAIGWICMILLEGLLSPPATEVFMYTLIPISSWSVFCAIIAILFRNRMPNLTARITCWLTIVSSALLAMFMSIYILREYSVGSGNELIIKLISYDAVLVICCLLLTLIISNTKQIHGTTEEQVIKIKMDISCPRCEFQQSILTGGASCCRCGLRIKVSIP